MVLPLQKNLVLLICPPCHAELEKSLVVVVFSTGRATTTWLQNLLCAFRRKKDGEEFLIAFLQKSSVGTRGSGGPGRWPRLHYRHRGGWGKEWTDGWAEADQKLYIRGIAPPFLMET